MTHRTLAAVLILLALAACGQSGPLYIPGDPSRVEQPPPPAEPPAEEETDENGETDK